MDKIDLKKTEIYAQGRRLGIKGALVGSVVFAFVDLLGGYINVHLIQRRATTISTENIVFTIIGFIILILFGSAIAYFPARLFGGFLARLFENNAGRNALTKKIAITKGAMIGAFAGITTSLPILIIQFNLFYQTGHGDFLVPIYRVFEATTIATLAGAWTGIQLEKILNG